MILIPSKCEFLRVTNKASLIHMSYHIQNEKIKEVPHAKHLGVTIDQHLTKNEHIKQSAAKANNFTVKP